MRKPTAGAFAGLIDGAFGLLRQTWKTALACGGIAYLPAAALYGWAYGRLFAAYAGVLPATEDGGLWTLLRLAGPLLWILLAALAQGLAVLFVRSCVTAQAAAAVRGREVSPAAAPARLVGRHGARLLGQRALQGLVYAGIAAAAAVVVAAASSVSGVFRPASVAAALAILLALLYAAILLVVLWLWVRFSLTLESVVIDGATPRQSFGLSASLVRGSRWRVLGYRLLFGIMLGFVASLVATPVVFFATIRAYARYLSEMVRGTADVGSLVDLLRSMGSGLPARLAVFWYLRSLLDALVAPSFMTLLYFEMKRRRARGP